MRIVIQVYSEKCAIEPSIEGGKTSELAFSALESTGKRGGSDTKGEGEKRFGGKRVEKREWGMRRGEERSKEGRSTD